ncbi:MAG: glutaredoxin domain-containing protein [Myxococcota bacterium]
MAILGLLLALAACKASDDQVADAAPSALPPLTLTDQTPDLLLTWVDAQGNTHGGTKLSEVPKDARGAVRIILPDAGNGGLLYVADLNRKASDGSYSVKTMKRSDWEKMIGERRDLPEAGPAGSANPARVADVPVIIYGASWCGPCHQAAAYLQKLGVRVVEYDIEKNPGRAKEMARKLRQAGMGGGSIPVIDVGGTILRGYNPSRLDLALRQAVERGTEL